MTSLDCFFFHSVSYSVYGIDLARASFAFGRLLKKKHVSSLRYILAESWLFTGVPHSEQGQNEYALGD